MRPWLFSLLLLKSLAAAECDRANGRGWGQAYGFDPFGNLRSKR